MVIRKDYIMRLIEEFAAVLARIVHKRSTSQFYAAHLTLNVFAGKIFPGYDRLSTLNAEELVRYCSYNGTFEPELCLLLGKLAAEEAILLKQMNSPGFAHDRAGLALRCVRQLLDVHYTFEAPDMIPGIIETLQPERCTKEHLTTIIDYAAEYRREDLLLQVYQAFHGVPAQTHDDLVQWQTSWFDDKL